MRKYKQGYYRPMNPEKYNGNAKGIVYRSSWEARVMKFLDSHPDVLLWSSEELAIPYISPKDNRPHRYFPDFIVKRINRNNKEETLLIEVKPFSQVKAPIPKKGGNMTAKQKKRLLEEALTWKVNEAKWEAAKEYCKDKGWIFKILSEKELGIK